MINGYGPAYGYLGYQVHTRKFFQALNALEPVCLVSTNPCPPGFAVAPELAQMTARVPAIDLANIAIAIAYGNDFHRFHGRRRIGFTVFETTRLADDWKNGMRQVDALWTTSAWGAEVIRANDIGDVPLGIVPEGFDPQVFHPGLRAERKRDGVFRFLAVGKWEARKGQSELVQAWVKAFRGVRDAELVLMCDNPFVPGFSVDAEVKKLGAGKAAPIKARRHVATDVEMAKIYASADCFVLPTRAEGWGLPIMEAMACGTPVITTRYSAITEYANDANAYLLNVKGMVPVYDPLFFPRVGEAGVWAEIDVDELAERLLEVYRDRAAAAERGACAAREMHERWTWAHAAQKAQAWLANPPWRAPLPPSAPALVPAVAAPSAVEAVRAGSREPAHLAALSITDIIGLAEGLSAAAANDEAVALYRAWIAHANSPVAFVARFNLGRILSEAGDLLAAESEYRAALVQNPGFIQAMLNLGSLFERRGQPAEAITEWQRAWAILQTMPNADVGLQKHALNNLGRLLEQQHRYAEASAILTQSLAVAPEQEEVIHHWVHLRQKQCAWPIYTPLPGVPVEAQVRATSALAMLSATNDPALQRDTARRFVEAKLPANLPPLAPAQGYAHEKLRIGYLSSNLNMHAVTILTAEVYELHDRARCEVWAFCWSPEDGTAMRSRIRAAMDHLVRIDTMTDAQAAAAIRAAEIDILVDLQGLTSGCRPAILAHRPAPVAVSWLGFPGTSGLPGVDYIVADRYLIPEEEAQHYSEKPLYLPDCFQSNDRQRTGGPLPKRADYKLPPDTLVFCAFNHNHKFNPEMFGTWMRILQRVPDSVLWLLADNESAHANLVAFATAHGIAGERLIFAPRVHPAEYLARFQLADLFLDTLPFNGGTTASDALWMGLPLLTCSGRTFAGRMAGSLLNAVGLPELVTHTLADYESLAVALAADRPRLATLRQRLQENRATHPLFDTPRLVKSLEDAFYRIARRPLAA